MYKKNYTTYTPTISDISRIPLDDLAKDYYTLFSSYKNTLAKAKQNYIDAKKLEYVRQYSAVNEGSYEGNFEELNLEETANKKYSDFSGLASQVGTLVEEFTVAYSLKKHSSWFLPQMLSKLAEMQPVKNSSGKLDVKQLVSDQIKPDPVMTGLWLLCRHPTRSSFLDKQTQVQNRNYSSLVPLLLSAFKKYNGTPYSAWDRNSVQGVVEPQLASIMTLTDLPEIPKDELLDLRAYSLTPKTGKDAGQQKNPQTTYSLYPPAGSVLSAMPMLLRIMLCQTWCAHPAVRTEYMILDPINWDNIPEAIIEESPLSEKAVGKQLESWMY